MYTKYTAHTRNDVLEKIPSEKIQDQRKKWKTCSRTARQSCLNFCEDSSNIVFFQLCRSTVVAGTEESLAENEVSPFNYFESDSVHGSSALPGSTTSIDLTLKDHADNCCDTLVFETCIPKQHLQLYFNQWAEFKKLIFIGPPGNFISTSQKVPDSMFSVVVPQ